MASTGKVLVFGIDARLQDVVAHGTFDFWSFRGRRTVLSTFVLNSLINS